jgi:hypothetical protein
VGEQALPASLFSDMAFAYFGGSAHRALQSQEAFSMTQGVLLTDPAAELRAELARRQVVIYRLAPIVGLHPSHLGQVLSGRRPLSPELADRIRRALSEDSCNARTPDAAA